MTLILVCVVVILGIAGLATLCAFMGIDPTPLLEAISEICEGITSDDE